MGPFQSVPSLVLPGRFCRTCYTCRLSRGRRGRFSSVMHSQGCGIGCSVGCSHRPRCGVLRTLRASPSPDPAHTAVPSSGVRASWAVQPREWPGTLLASPPGTRTAGPRRRRVPGSEGQKPVSLLTGEVALPGSLGMSAQLPADWGAGSAPSTRRRRWPESLPCAGLGLWVPRSGPGEFPAGSARPDASSLPSFPACWGGRPVEGGSPLAAPSTVSC